MLKVYESLKNKRWVGWNVWLKNKGSNNLINWINVNNSFTYLIILLFVSQISIFFCRRGWMRRNAEQLRLTNNSLFILLVLSFSLEILFFLFNFKFYILHLISFCILCTSISSIKNMNNNFLAIIICSATMPVAGLSFIGCFSLFSFYLCFHQIMIWIWVL